MISNLLKLEGKSCVVVNQWKSASVFGVVKTHLQVRVHSLVTSVRSVRLMQWVI